MSRCLLFCIFLVFALLSRFFSDPSSATVSALATDRIHQSDLVQSTYPKDDNYLGPYLGKIAFLFLTRGDIPHSTLWEIFFNFHAPSTHYSIYWHTQVPYSYRLILIVYSLFELLLC
ncbi:hypothetical protein EON63_20695 [archaeon]|nr:MAG: hypothetical protein EON63_20695 [archaeon]